MKITPGQQLAGLPARDWNRHEDAAAALLDRGLRVGDFQPTYPTGVMLLKNNSGSHCARHRIFGIDGLQVSWSDSLVEAQFSPLLDGAAPSASYRGKWAVALADIPDGAIGPVVVSGPAVVELDNPGSPPAHPFADTDTSGNKAKSNWYGAARLLATEVTGGTRWALVVLGPFVSPAYPAKVTESGGISAGSSGDLDIYVNGSSEETVTGHLSWAEGTQDAAENAECFAQYFLGDDKWRIISLDCEA